MGTNGNQWGANGKAVGKFKRYVLPFVINGNSMVDHWENSNGIFDHSLLMGDRWNITGNILVKMSSRFILSYSIVRIFDYHFSRRPTLTA